MGDYLELPNGCVCCSVRSEFALAVETLLAKRRFDHIILECSGLADPGPLARMFWVDEELESAVFLDGIAVFISLKENPRFIFFDIGISFRTTFVDPRTGDE